jgi:hypothetical protein
MRKNVIKKHKNKNLYYLTDDRMWVRDFTKISVPRDINNLIPVSDYDVILSNEMKNATLNIASIDAETIYAPNVIIVSDGHKFEEKQLILKDIPQKNVTIIGVNRSLAKWARHTRLDWYLANNPYKECMSYLPSFNYYPRCIVSSRVNPNFVMKYRSRLGVIYRYIPVSDEGFSSHYFQQPLYHVDDYRNPICAAISIAFRWGAQRVLLFCCDDAFEGERPGAVQLENSLWMYPQHRISQGLIDGSLYWLANQEIKVKIANHSSGPEYSNAPYITEDQIVDFFK